MSTIMSQRGTVLMKRGRRGFSLIEMLLSLVVFLVLSGSMLALLNMAQVRVHTESNSMPSLQKARAGLQTMVREIRLAGYPSPYTFAATPSDPSMAPYSLQKQFAIGYTGWPAQGCMIGSSCAIPSGFDLVLEENPDPSNPVGGVNWVEYRLVLPAGATAGTLMRSLVPKLPGSDPRASANFVPLVENVLNDPTNPSDAIFFYYCGTLPSCTTDTVQQIVVSLRVRSYERDIKTGQYPVFSLIGEAARQNPVR